MPFKCGVSCRFGLRDAEWFWVGGFEGRDGPVCGWKRGGVGAGLGGLWPLWGCGVEVKGKLRSASRMLMIIVLSCVKFKSCWKAIGIVFVSGFVINCIVIEAGIRDGRYLCRTMYLRLGQRRFLVGRA